jgi:hypothetical protein
MVTAEEVGVFVYCPESWRLEYGLGLLFVAVLALNQVNELLLGHGTIGPYL